MSTSTLHDLATVAPLAVAYANTFGRTRQTQTASPATGLVVVSGATIYDDRGLTPTVWSDYSAPGTPDGGMQAMPAAGLRTVTEYVGARRPNSSTHSVSGQPDLVTTTDHDIWSPP